MKQILSAIILFSLLSLQFHGLSHVLEEQDSYEHSCAICEVESHSVGLKSGFPQLIIITPVILAEKFVIIRKSAAQASFFESTSSRGPPTA